MLAGNISAGYEKLQLLLSQQTNLRSTKEVAGIYRQLATALQERESISTVLFNLSEEFLSHLSMLKQMPRAG